MTEIDDRPTSADVLGLIRIALFPASRLLRAIADLSTDELQWNKLLCDSHRSIQLQDAIEISSPSFSQQLRKYDAVNEMPERVRETLIRFVMRAHWRATPYGLFSGVGLLWKAPHPQPQTASPTIDKVTALVRLDREVLARNLVAIQGAAQNEASLHVRSNPNAMEFGGSLRLLRFGAQQAEPHYTVEEIQLSAEVHEIAHLAKIDASMDECINRLEQLGVDRSQGRSFVRQLIEAGVLLALPYRSDSAFYETSAKAFLVGRTDTDSIKLRNALDLTLQTYMRSEVVPVQRQVNELLDQSPARHSRGATVHVDSFIQTNAPAVLSEPELGAIRSAVKALWDLAPRIDTLSGMRTRLLRRFGTSLVPILHAFDPIVGVDVEAALADFDQSVRDRRRSAALSDLLLDALQNRMGQHIELTEDDIKRIVDGTFPPIPPTFFALVERLGGALQADTALHLRYAGGTPAARLLTRFSDLDPSIDNLIYRIREVERLGLTPEIPVELLYSQSSRVGNITRRPLRSEEISLAIAGGESLSENQLSLSDIGIAVTTDERSIRLVRLADGKPIIPQATTALNFENKGVSPIYQFLCRLQFSRSPEFVSWNWGELGNSRYLPRVSFGGVVLSRATWRLSGKLVAKLRTGSVSSNLETLRRLDIPPVLAYTDGDRELPLNLASAELVRAILPPERSVSLTEILELAHIPNKHEDLDWHRSELLVVGQMDPELAKRSSSRPSQHYYVPLRLSDSAVDRYQRAGGKWISLRVYNNSGAGDSVLTRTIGPYFESNLNEKLFEQWFFIRYRDEEDHLRLRAYVADESTASLRLSEMLSLLYADPAIWKVEVDTYLRELERFGGHSGLCLLEKLFCIDSIHAYNALRMEAAQEQAASRYAIWCGHAAGLCRILGYTLQQLSDTLSLWFGRTSTDWSVASRFIRQHERDARASVGALSNKSMTLDEASLADAIKSSGTVTASEILLTILHLSYIRHWGVGDRAHERSVHLLLLRVVRGLTRRD